MPHERIVNTAPNLSIKAAWLESYMSVGFVKDEDDSSVYDIASPATESVVSEDAIADGSVAVSADMFASSSFYIFYICDE